MTKRQSVHYFDLHKELNRLSERINEINRKQSKSTTEFIEMHRLEGMMFEIENEIEKMEG